MKIALLQFSPIWESKEDNILKINDLVNNIKKDTEILIFPEMTLTGFTMNSQNYSEEIDGIGMKYFLKLSSELKMNIMAGIIEKYHNKFYNSLFHFDNKGLIKAVYRKVHPFSLAEEDKNFDAGNESVITKIDKTKIGLSICYDLRFPELYRLYGKEKTEIIVNIANWPIKRIDHWKSLLKARAIENQCYMIGVNRIGEDPFQKYNGFSAVYDPMGKEIIICENEEKIIYAEIDIQKVYKVREKLGFLKDIKLI
ncbi:MAG: carbon-nitrogen family hydrolase [Ignavibacteriales bacterium]|nr:carbon-nitrogen family hydrolase [Ignavibacteriales bacterium]